MRSPPQAVRAVVVLALLSSACSEKTSILVEVSSDLAIPEEVNGLRFVVSGDAAGSMLEETYAIEGPWPHSVSIRPGEVESQGITVEVSALRDDGFVARRSVRAMFVAGQETVVRVDIDRACVGIQCPAGSDCRDGRCTGVPPPDGGMMDGGVVDAGCTMASQCDDAVNCTVDTCEDGSCVHRPDDAICVEGETCDAVEGCPPRVCADDAECNDRVACNGAELCQDMACVAGPPIDCNDGLDCTSDRCSEAMRECVHGTRDLDGDGFGDLACEEVGGVPATDCDDGNADVFPGAPETCNGLDDNCDSACDEGFTCCRGASEGCATECGTTGTRVCGASCGWSVCAPPAETCNGVDDDCNGAADDIFSCVQGASEACTTSCGSSGTRTCGADCAWSDCVAPAETCNGRDDDCDGAADDTFSCVSASSTPCTTSCASTGTITCDAVSCEPGACAPPAEGCTGVDDDCDGNVDESVECSAGSTEPCMTSCGSAGTRTCSASCIFGSCTAPDEVCNGQDDDCDGRIDETFTCVPMATGTCTTSCATTGMRTCTASCTWGACTPPTESCNGLDDDCDAMCDEAFTCCAGSSGSCTTSCGTTGSRTCSAACGWSACSPPAESCNGVDDDCNGACDDGFTCCAGRTGACTTSCGSTGTRTCAAGCEWGAVCTPPVEACGGGDDDCDGLTDEGFACSPGGVRNCTTSCGSTGSQTCLPDCTYGSCNPPTESCNGVDDDCDAMTDEGCGACGACAGASTVSGAGGRYEVTLGAHAQTGSCGGAGSEAYLTFTLSAVSDVFITTHQAGAVDTVLYVRDCECAGAELASGCNDDADGRTTSVLRLRDLAVGTYNVVVDTKTAMSGTVPVDVYISAPGMESDRCGDPSPILAGATRISGSTCGYGSDYQPDLGVVGDECSTTNPAAGFAEDRVYYFYLPTSRAVTFSGCNTGSSYDSTTFVRRVCSDSAAANQVWCNDDGCTGPNTCDRSYRSSWTTTLPAGLHYVFVDGYLASCGCGNFQFDLAGI